MCYLNDMTHILAISNQKGGVGKTTSAISISYELAAAGQKVLLVDFDPQGSAGSGLGIRRAPNESEQQLDLYDVFFGEASLSDVVVNTPVSQLLDVAPSSADLISIEAQLGKKAGRELILSSEISLLRNKYDFILVDCPPSSGLLTLNALGAADGVLIPLQAEYYALEGLSALIKTIDFVKSTFNPRLSIFGVFITMFDKRTNLSLQVESESSNYFSNLMFNSRIPRNIKLSECPSHGLPIGVYDSQSAGARAYRELAMEIMERCSTWNIAGAANVG